MGRHAYVWDDATVATFKRLWADKSLRAVDIADRLGLSKNAILGKASRLDLPKRRGAAKPRPPKPEPKPRRKAPRPVLVKPPALPVHEKPKGNAWEALEGIKPVGLLELEAGMCKWPIGEEKPFLFCGAPSLDGQPYCQHHHNLSVGAGSSLERAAVKIARYIGRQEIRTANQGIPVVSPTINTINIAA